MGRVKNFLTGKDVENRRKDEFGKVYQALKGMAETSASALQHLTYEFMRESSRYNQVRELALQGLENYFKETKKINPQFERDCIGADPIVTAYRMGLPEAVTNAVSYVDRVPQLRTNRTLENIVAGTLATSLTAEKYLLEIPNEDGTVKYVPRKASSLDAITIGEIISGTARNVLERELRDKLVEAMGKEAYKRIFGKE